MSAPHPKANESPIVTDFSKFILRRKVSKGNAFTHTIMGHQCGAYYIQAETYDQFLRDYANAIDNGLEICITEKHRHLAPVLVDLDLRYSLDGRDTEQPQRIHTPQHLYQIARIYAQEIVKIFQPTEDTFILYVLEKPGATIAQKQLKDGIHIIVPSIVSKPPAQYVLRNRVKPQLEHLFQQLKTTNNIDDIVDEAVIERNNWMMYGSRKPGGQPYAVTHMFEYSISADTLTEVINEYEFTTRDLVTEFSIRNKHDETSLNPGAMEDIREIENVLNERRRKMETSKSIIGEERNNDATEYHSLEEVTALVDILDSARAGNYHDWIRLGWCLRNIDHRLLDKWIEFSRKSPKFRDGECDRAWAFMRKSGLGIGTLHMWAKNDNPTAYAEIIRNDLRKLLFESRTGTHNDVARVVHHMFKHSYVCAGIRNKVWYEFKNHRWHHSDSGFTLRARLSDEVWKEYMGAARDLSHRATEATDQDQQEKYHEYAKKMLETAQKLKTTNFKDNVMKECAEMFYEDKFEEKLDSHPNLIGFENGVYDLDSLEFREGRPEDYVSFCTKINYVPFDPSHPIINDLKQYWAQVLTRPNVREYVMKLFSTFLHGAIKEQKFNIWTGSGCHTIDAPIMMADGSIKKVQDIEVGDQLMGDDSTPRNVLKLCRGFADMYKIIPVKGESFVVNGDHIMALEATNMFSCYRRPEKKTKSWVVRWMDKDKIKVCQPRSKHFLTEDEAKAYMEDLKKSEHAIKPGEVIDVKLRDYIQLVKYIGSRNFYLYRPKDMEYTHKVVDMDPYIMGAWLGDGSKRNFNITTMDDEIICYVKEHSHPNIKYNKKIKKNADGTINRAFTYEASKIEGHRMEKNEMDKCLHKYNVVNNKHIPLEYKCNSREVRMKVLAGLIDTDGTYQAHTNQFTVSLKSERLMDDLIYLARSLGFACYKTKFIGKCHNNGKEGTYFRTHIVGDGIEDIPTLLNRKMARKRIKNKDVRRVSFKIERVDDDNFYGFELDGNHRYLDGEFITQHNSNSKSICVNLFENSFGDYCCKFPITLLTQKRAASNAATAELARAKGKRFACLQEPSEDEKLNIGLMKELSGGDKIMARALFSNPIEFTPQFKMLLLCNHLPAVPSDDGGTWRRIRVVEFTSKFVDNPQEENEFPIDYDLPNKMLGWKEHFMSMLIEYYKLYKVEGNPEPQEVLECTNEYKRQNDHLYSFLTSCIEDKANSFLSVNEAFAELKAWVKDDNIPMKIPTKAELEKAMSKHFGKCVIGNNVKGFRNKRIRNRNAVTEVAPAQQAASTSAHAEAEDSQSEIGDGID